ncbi:MAG: hypothetical protein ACXIVQ_06045 [Acidimicrobiales bacterium]
MSYRPSPLSRSPRCLAAVLVAVVMLSSVACSEGADAGRDTASDTSVTTTSRPPVPSTTSPPTTVPTTTTSPTSTTTTSSSLPLLPTTSTTAIDRGTDPPVPVADPDGGPGANSVLVVGDSVFLGTASSIPVALPDWLVTYDASGNRRLAQAVELIAERRPEVGEAVVIHLGNNFIEGERGTYGSQIDEIMTILDGVPRVVWVTVSEVSPSRQQINVEIREAAERWPAMRVADWAPIVAAHPEWTFDGVHLTSTGRREMAELVSRTLGPVGPHTG